jgi:hypothetical protein
VQSRLSGVQVPLAYLSSTISAASLMRYLSFVLSTNRGMAIATVIIIVTPVTVRTVVSKRLINATSFSLTTLLGCSYRPLKREAMNS